ncbi:MAG: hypothetical protein AB1346_10470 [Thermodesulfobacteriota bacterium]
MILHPPILALLAGALLGGFLLLFASRHAIRILRRWDLDSGSELQLELERRTCLVSTVVAYACAFQAASLFLFVYTADDLAALFVGAMCAAGTLHANPYGYPALGLKAAGAVLSGVWLVVNHADNRGRDYPLIREKYVFLLALVPLFLAETAAMAAYFGGLKAEVITSCCGSLFGGSSTGVGSELASLPVFPMQAAFYASVAALLAAGAVYLRRGAGGRFAAAAGMTAFAVSLASIVSFISPFVYELPTHRCPFCILQREYHYIGYPMYGLLFAGAVSSAGLGWLGGRRIPSLASVLPPLTRRLAVTAMVCFGAFAALVTWAMLSTSFRLEGY